MLLTGLLTQSGRRATGSSWQSAVDKIIQLESEYTDLDDQQLRKAGLSLRYEVLSGQPLEKILVRSFALVREAAWRKTGMRHYPVQLLGGVAMHYGSIAVMQTGEGKTLTATLPLYVAALTGEGAHLATANDYLAGRDAKLMSPIFNALGLSVGVVVAATDRPQRQRSYRADITYSTAKEIGFDFLRDRLLIRRLDDGGVEFSSVREEHAAGPSPVQKAMNFMLVDEADSILIDEARTPLIISSIPDLSRELQRLYRWAADSISQFREAKHYRYDEAKREVQLTSAGRTLARKLPKPDDLACTAMQDIYDQLELALLVQHQFVRDRHYVIRDGEVVIVDEFTGRMAEGRKWRAGLHQAIEARENLEVSCETAEAARITIQDLFLRYRRLAGMTGTVANSGRELKKIYQTPVVRVPTNRPAQRQQYDDRVFDSEISKWNAIVAEVMEIRNQQRPVLIGTRSIDKSEHLSQLLREKNIPHAVLNARNLEREAAIVSEAGRAGQVTVATNMAGRGTDIQLHDEARDNGGLHVIVSELHESARIDRQLTGRCGRQGDPGTYRHYMSLDDDILKTGLGPAAAARIKSKGIHRRGDMSEVAKLFRRAQKAVERKHFRGRKMLLFLERQRQTAQRELGMDPYVDTIS